MKVQTHLKAGGVDALDRLGHVVTDQELREALDNLSDVRLANEISGVYSRQPDRHLGFMLLEKYQDGSARLTCSVTVESATEAEALNNQVTAAWRKTNA